MKKQEFLDILGRRLAQVYSQTEIKNHIQYYDDYIQEKVNQGISEEEAVASLGDPLLIAKSIMDVNEYTQEARKKQTVYEESDGEWNEEVQKQNKKGFYGMFQKKEQIGCLLTVMIVLVLLVVLIRFLGGIVLRLLPMALPILLILGVISMFRRR